MKSDKFSQSWRKVRNLLLSAIALGAAASIYTPAFAQPYEPPGFDPNPNHPRIYHVSKNGNNTDGLTWATAWNEMDQIQWSQISAQRHDSLLLDGGARRMIYNKPLHPTLQPSYYGLIPVSLSTEAGHNGQVVIQPPADSKGIEINTGGISLNGVKRSGILVWGAKDGLYVNANGPIPMMVKNVEMAHCNEAGLYVNSSYYPVQLSQLIIHDNATNVLVPTNGYPGGPTLNKCWIYNSSYQTNSDGVQINGSIYGPPATACTVTNSVLGPGLRDGVSNNSSSRPSLNNCLMINATRNNVNSYSVSMENVTSFMTRLNPHQMAHDCIKLQATGLPYGMIGSSVKKTIAFGGVVEIPNTITLPYPPGQTIPFPITVENNTQFRVTGNTTILAPSMVNPQFVEPVGLLPNQTPIPILMRLDFTLRPGSPAAGTGSTITSVQNLLSTFD